MPEILNWRSAADPRVIIDRAVQTLDRGRLVAFPTETVYGIAASVRLPDAIERLTRSKGRPDDKPLTLAVRNADEAFRWAPGMGTVGCRLARRCWPGPLTLVSEVGLTNGPLDELDDQVRQRISPHVALGLRVPAHQAILATLAELPDPLALTSANLSGRPDATTAAEVAEAVGAHVDLVIDDGPSYYGKPSTVVQVSANSWKVLREGVLPADLLRRLAGCMILFVCTGNTCRSPLAEVLLKKRLADSLGCTVDQLPDHGFLVLSGGLAAMAGGGAAPEAVAVARELGADLTQHSSRPLTADLLRQADWIVTMTQGHLQILAQQFPELGPRLRLLAANGDDVPDPIGSDQPVYRECARVIQANVDLLAAEVQQA